MNATLKSALLGAAVLGLTAGANIARADDAKPAEPAAAAAATCVEKNSCKGHGSCAGMQGGASHDCKGHNGCAKNERTGLDAKACKKIKGSFKKA
jgi:hypothetical protein